MKIRSGFVSNSSSASFVVTTKSDPERLCSVIFDQMGDYFSKESHVKLLNDRIKDQEGYISEFNLKIETLKNTPKEERMRGYNKSYDMLDMENDRLENSKKYLGDIIELKKDIEKYPDSIYNEPLDVQFEYLKKISNFHHVRLNKITDKKWKFRNWVSMYNDYTDMVELLRDFIVVAKLHKIKFDMEVLED